MSLTATVLLPTAVKANNSSPTVISEFKRGTAFLTMAETWASSHMFLYKSGPWEHLQWKETFVLGTKFVGITAAVPQHLQLLLQHHGLNPHLHTLERGQTFKQAESLIFLFPLAA